MLRWAPFPFVRFTSALIVGVLLAIWQPELPPQYWMIPLTVGMVGLAIAKIGYRRYAAASWLGGMSGLVAWVAFGFGYTQLRTEHLQEQHLTYIQSPITHFQGVVVSAEEERANTWRARVQVNQVQTDSGWQIAEGLVILYQRKDSHRTPLHYGDHILVQGNPERIEGPKNPGAFDYRNYMARQQVHHQAFTDGPAVIIQKNSPPSTLTAIAIEARQAFQERLNEGIKSPREQAIVWALVLGIKDGLDPETRQAYATAGAMHVLAVSGLHVGIIYAVFAALIGGLRRHKLGRYVFAGWIILCLWGFAFLTGLSPSVMRAATMFSFMAIGQSLQRPTNIYNTLASSAFVLLLVNPFLITSVGFQLSYLAVLGIVYLQPRIYGWWNPPNRILDWAWQLTAVSIAAQIATGPLAVFYFHVFPTYFFLSNLIVVPLATFILIGGLAVLAASVIHPALAQAIAWALEWLVWGMNEAVFALEKLPGSQIEDLVLSPNQVILLCISLIAFFAFWAHRKFRYLLYSATAWVLLMVLSLQTSNQWRHQRGFTVYDLNRTSAANLYLGTQRIRHWNGPWDEGDYQFQMLGHEQQMGFQPNTHPQVTDSLFTESQGPWQVALWQGKTIAWLQSPISGFQNSYPWPSVDYLIVSHNALQSLAPLPPDWSPGTLILDSSNKLYIAARLKEEAQSRGWAYHSVPHQGAYTANW